MEYLEKKNYLFEYISDIGEDGEKAFDSNLADRYESTNSVCYAGIKLLSDNILISLKSIKVYLQKSRTISPENFNGIRFEGSIDGITWELITEPNPILSTSLHLKDFDQNATLAYKYLRYVHSLCNLDKV